MLEAAIFVIFPFCMAFAAVSDLLSMTIANRVSVLLVAAFAVLAPLTGMGWEAYGLHFAAGGLALLVTFVLFAFGGMGGGDAKLIAATVLWFGVSVGALEYLLVASISGGLLTLLLLVYRNSPLAAATGGNLLLRKLADAGVGIPYAIALGLAGLLTYPHSPLMQWALARLSAP